jgi:NAD(P)-dependent dehydrogenase (short-subunit alcohol dehydrogenase family)
MTPLLEPNSTGTGGQFRLHTGFGPATTASEVLNNKDLTGTTAIVTGGHSGLGLETTRALARAGAKVVVPARVPERARDALAGLAGVTVDKLDLTNPRSIDAFAARFLARSESLKMLINSAGIMAAPMARDSRGIESQFSTNHLGHFQLTLRLWPALRRSQAARVISVSSRGHQIAGLDLADINFERRPYDKWVAYGQSKTANVLFAVGFGRSRCTLAACSAHSRDISHRRRLRPSGCMTSSAT